MPVDHPRAAVLTDCFLHPTDDVFLPTAENLLLLQLGRCLTDELGWAVDIHQISSQPERCFAGLQVVGVDTKPDRNGMFPELNFTFAQTGLDYDLRIYHHWHLAFPQVAHKSIVVSHGVFWDSPNSPLNRQNPVGRQEWLKRLCYAVAAPAAFVAQDRNTVNVIKAFWPGYEHRLCYLPPGVDLDLFHPTAEHVGGSPIRVACPQDFGHEQGLSEIIALCELAAAEEPRLEFHLLGRLGDFAIASQVARRVQALPNCRYYWVPTAAWPGLYRSFDLAILPYRAAAGPSLHCLQAMASGLPVVAGLAGGLSELVVDGCNGFLVPPGSAKRLLPPVLDLTRDSDLRLRLGANARRLAEGYPLEAWKRRWRELIEEVLGT